MHTSPPPRRTLTVTALGPTRADRRARRGTFVFHIAAAWVCLVVLWGSSVSAATPVPQERPPVTTEQAPTSDQADATATESFQLSDDVVKDVLTNLQIGMETHELERVLEIFDQQNMKDYAQFRDQITAFFRRYDSVKFRYQLLQVTADKDGGFAIADIDMDADPSDILPTPQRRSTQMRFQMKHVAKGWKVVSLRPADFFNQ